MCKEAPGMHTAFPGYGIPADQQEHTTMRPGKTLKDKVSGSWGARLANRAAKAQANRDRYGKK